MSLTNVGLVVKECLIVIPPLEFDSYWEELFNVCGTVKTNLILSPDCVTKTKEEGPKASNEVISYSGSFTPASEAIG